MKIEIAEWLSEKAEASNNFEISTGDVLDVKAGVLLVIATFLATTATTIVMGESSPEQKAMQAIAMLFLAGSGMFAVAELWVKKYSVDKVPKEYLKWVRETEAHWEEHKPAQEITEYLWLSEAESTGKAAEENRVINQKKVWSLKRAFWLLLVPLAIDLLWFVPAGYKLIMPLFQTYLSRAVAVAEVLW